MSLERRILLWMCVLTAVNQLGFGGVMPSLPLYAASFGVSASAIGLSVGIYGLARFCVAAPAGQISDRMGRRKALALGGAITAAGNLWSALAVTYPEFILARFVAGAGAGLIVTTGQIVLADITTPERRGRMMAIYQGTFIFAVGIGPLPGGFLAAHFGLTAPFWAYTVAGAISGVLAWFAVGETRDIARAKRVHAPGEGPSYWMQLRQLRRQVGYMLVCLVALINAVARTGGLFSLVPLIAHTRLGLSVTTIGFGLAAGSVAGLVATYPAGMLVDYFGRKVVIWPASIIAGVSMLLFCFAASASWFLVACLVWGVAIAIGGAAPAAYAADSAPPGLNATTMSMYRMAGDAGYVAGPILLGMLADWQGAEAALVVSALLLGGVGLLFAIVAPESYRRG
ncbi:MAG: MFS transporter [Acetobacteraceae bacterium]|nr:MFS transporter [Acetobacteraceae bacterium]MSP29485.1 MFS transporter [Acetobacteraceae bacterium]